MEPAQSLGRLLGAGQVAEVFEFGDGAIKLFRAGVDRASAFREAATLATLDGSGLPVPQVHSVTYVSGRWGVVMSRAPDGPATLPTPRAMAMLHWRIHGVSVNRLGALKAKLAQDIALAKPLTASLREGLVQRLETLPDGHQLCHGDFHPGNILGSAEAPIVVDWLDATTGSPEADACRTYLLALHHAPALAEPYLDAYAQLSGAGRDTVIAWLPVVAGARLSEGVPNETDRLLRLVDALD